MEKRLRSKGWGPWRKEWYSFCSRHFYWRDDCPACNAGTWYFVHARWIGGVVYKRAPRVWLWWANRPNSSANRLLQAHFPRLRRR